ncbi:MAG: hypothetical protein HC831_21485 [Chloroflexia bacterium]|nr:hypothetical protein [Chloroflexia bacterium]
MKKELLFYSLSALLLGAAFAFESLCILVFVVFVPIIYSRKNLCKASTNISNRAFLNLFFALLSNFIALNWALNDDPLIGFFMIIANSIIMFLPLFIIDTLSFLFKVQKIHQFFLAWLLFEIVSLNWDFNFPWLLLGNTLSKYPFIIQWYEYTGVIGGSVWIILINFLVYQYLFVNKRAFKMLFATFFPILVSLYLWFNCFQSNTNPRNIVIIQPNIEPRYEKKHTPLLLQVNKVLNLLKSCDDTINYVVLPETFMNENLPIEFLNSIPYFQQINNSVRKSENFLILSGISLVEKYSKDSTLFFNSIVCNDGNRVISIYNKEKFIPFIEKTPYRNIFNPVLLQKIETFFETCNYSNDSKNNYHISKNGDKIASFVCYEGLFCNYFSKIVNETKSQGSNCII